VKRVKKLFGRIKMEGLVLFIIYLMAIAIYNIYEKIKNRKDW